MSDLFISYAHEDRPIAAAIAERLVALGVDVWWDHDLLGGEDYRARISEILSRTQAAIVIWSRRSTESHWVLNEAAAASERQCLIPVAIDNQKPPIDFRSIHTIDLAKWLPGDALPVELVRAIESRLKRQIQYEPTASRSNTVARLAYRTTAAWYLDFEALLFYLMGHGLGCFLLELPIPILERKLAVQGTAMLWAPYAVAMANGLMVAALYMRPVLQYRRLPIASLIFLAAALLSLFAYLVAKAVTAALTGDEVLIIVGLDTFAFILVSAIADRAIRQR